MGTGREIISFDYAMKYILRQRANFDILESFLEALLGYEVTIVEILESESDKDRIGGKLNRVDLIAKDTSGTQMVIEIQYNREDDYLERILWETSKIIADSLDSSDPYGNITKVISISILYFNLGRGNGYVYKGKVAFEDIGDKKNPQPLKLKRDVFPEYYLINVERFKDIIETPLDEWMYIFKNSKVPTTNKAKHMDKVQEKLDILQMTAKEKKAYEYHLKETRIAKSVLKSAVAEGEKRGEARGKAEGLVEGEIKGEVKTLYTRLKMTPQEIADDLAVPLDTVEQIISQF
ncbi:MAG: hypothetical protein ATN35_03035 [Epulopiscium sp. Nele67-Bin004]|nr:MAG: hypothetical protein ATN35_03035 [Epulopiscium sp. Nele67-Bin004]